MFPSRRTHYKSRLWRHTVLTASDSKNSVLCEMAGGINHVAYSPYGQQSAQQKVMTRVGFNGELREANTDWYFLGNGYRVYNPRSMRFHSPDSLSPFGEGGLNYYGYCGCEPVMNLDPSGRTFWSKLLKVWDFFSLNNTSSGPTRNMLSVQAESGKSGLLDTVGSIVKYANVNKRSPLESAGGKGRIHSPPSWKGSQTGHHSTATTVPINLKTKKPQPHLVLTGNYGARPDNVFSTVKTRDGLQISNTDSGNRQFPSGSRAAGSSPVSNIRS